MEALLLQDLSGFFENARQARKWLVALPLQYNTERIYKGAHAYIHLTGVCKVACEHCMYSSDYTARLPKPSLNSLEVDLANKYINDSGSQKLTISGGGEPFLKLNALLSLISKSFVPHIEIDTAGDWAISANKTVKILSSLSKALEEIPALAALFNEVELPLMFVLMKMETEGIGLDINVLSEIKTHVAERLITIREKISACLEC